MDWNALFEGIGDPSCHTVILRSAQSSFPLRQGLGNSRYVKGKQALWLAEPCRLLDAYFRLGLEAA